MDLREAKTGEMVAELVDRYRKIDDAHATVNRLMYEDGRGKTLEERARKLTRTCTAYHETDAGLERSQQDLQDLLIDAMRQVDANTRKLDPNRTKTATQVVIEESENIIGLRLDTYKTLKEKADAFDDKGWLKLQANSAIQERLDALLEAAKGGVAWFSSGSMVGDAEAEKALRAAVAREEKHREAT